MGLYKAQWHMLSHFHYPFFMGSTLESIQHGQCAQSHAQAIGGCQRTYESRQTVQTP